MNNGNRDGLLTVFACNDFCIWQLQALM